MFPFSLKNFILQFCFKKKKYMSLLPSNVFHFEIHNKLRDVSLYNVPEAPVLFDANSQFMWSFTRQDLKQGTIEFVSVYQPRRFNDREKFDFLTSRGNIGILVMNPKTSTLYFPQNLDIKEENQWLLERSLIIRNRIEYLTNEINSNEASQVRNAIGAGGSLASLAFPPATAIITAVTSFVNLFVSESDKTNEKQELNFLSYAYGQYFEKYQNTSSYLSAEQKQELQTKFEQKYNPVLNGSGIVDNTSLIPKQAVSSDDNTANYWIFGILILVVGIILYNKYA